MKLHQIELKSFRLFKDFTCSFGSDLTVLVGQNGLGKNLIIDITIAFGQFVGGFGTGHDVGIRNDDIRLEKFLTASNAGSPVSSAEYMELQLPVTIEDRILKETSTISCIRIKQHTERSYNTSQRAKRVGARLSTGSAKRRANIVTLISLLWNWSIMGSKRLTENKKPTSAIHTSRLDGYIDCMDPASSYSAFSVWFRQKQLLNMNIKWPLLSEKNDNPDLKISCYSQQLLTR